MKRLIYSLALGKKYYYQMADFFTASLRYIGNYQDDIILLVDNDKNVSSYVWDLATVVKTKENAIENKKSMKMLARTYINFEKYDQVIFFDIDMITIKDINVFLNSLSLDKFHCVEQGTPMDKPGYSWETNSLEVLEGMKSRIGLCSGFVAGPGETFAAMLLTWEEIKKTIKHRNAARMYDMPAFNNMVFHEYYDFEIVPKDTYLTVTYPSQPILETSVMVDYSGIRSMQHLGVEGRLKNKIFAVKELYNKYKVGPSLSI